MPVSRRAWRRFGDAPLCWHCHSNDSIAWTWPSRDRSPKQCSAPGANWSVVTWYWVPVVQSTLLPLGAVFALCWLFTALTFHLGPLTAGGGQLGFEVVVVVGVLVVQSIVAAHLVNAVPIVAQVLVGYEARAQYLAECPPEIAWPACIDDGIHGTVDPAWAECRVRLVCVCVTIAQPYVPSHVTIGETRSGLMMHDSGQMPISTLVTKNGSLKWEQTTTIAMTALTRVQGPHGPGHNGRVWVWMPLPCTHAVECN